MSSQYPRLPFYNEASRRNQGHFSGFQDDDCENGMKVLLVGLILHRAFDERQHFEFFSV